MPKHCFVPNCQTGYSSQTRKNREKGLPNPPVFSTPLKPEEFEVWKQKIPRKDRDLTPNDFVCSLHFTDDCINYFTKPLFSGDSPEKRKSPILKPGAVPSIFPTHPAKTRKLPKEREGVVPAKKRKSTPGLSENIEDFQTQVYPTLADLHSAIQSVMTSHEEFTDYTHTMWKNCIIIQKWDSNVTALNKLIIKEDFQYTAYVKDSTVVINEVPNCSSPANVLQVLRIIDNIPICNADVKNQDMEGSAELEKEDVGGQGPQITVEEVTIKDEPLISGCSATRLGPENCDAGPAVIIKDEVIIKEEEIEASQDMTTEDLSTPSSSSASTHQTEVKDEVDDLHGLVVERKVVADDEIARILLHLEEEDLSEDVEIEQQIDSDDDEEVLTELENHLETLNVEDQVFSAVSQAESSVPGKADSSQNSQMISAAIRLPGKPGPPLDSSEVSSSQPSTSHGAKINNKRKTSASASSSSQAKISKKDGVPENQKPATAGSPVDSRILTSDKSEFFGEKNCHKWLSQSQTSFTQIRSKNVVSTKKGPMPEARSALTPIECFKLFLTDEIVEKMLKHTNEEIRMNRENYKVQNNPTLKDMILEELYALLGLLLLGAALKNNHLNAEMLFKSEYCGDHYRACFSLSRFKFLLACLRFDDEATRQERVKLTALAPISEIWECFLEQCRKLYNPGPYLTIDEQLVGFRGRVSFMMYIPSKPDKYGMKVIMMCDSSTYYMVDAIAYTGKNCSPPGVPTAEYYVDKLVSTVKGSNRNITMDNWFVSIDLAKKLLQDKLTMVGTIKNNKRELPPEFVDLKFQNRRIGSSFFLFDNNMTAVSYKANTQTIVTHVSTMHDEPSIRESTGKPEIIHTYNETKGGVDSLDQMCHNMDCKRKCNRWPLAFFYNMLNIASVDAFVIYVHNIYKVQKKPLSRLNFMLQLHKELTADFLRIRMGKKGIPTHVKETIKRSRPSIKEVAASQQNNNIQTSRKICALCYYKLRRMTKSFCYNIDCRNAICVEHTVKICTDCHRRQP